MVSGGEINHITGDIHFISLLLPKRRTILTIHDIQSLQSSNFLKSFILKLFWITLPVKSVQIVTTVSQATRDELRRVVDVPEHKIKIVYDPVSPAFKPVAKPFNRTEPVILQIGTKANKNLYRLIEALKNVPCKLDIVGRLNADILSALERSGVNYVNSFNLTQAQLISKYEECDIVSFVSLYEGFGMPIIEANSVGRVVITSSVSSMPEIAGDSAHFVDPLDVSSIKAGILCVIENTQYRDTLITNGFKNAKRFDAVAIAEAYTALYKTLTDDKNY
jgi:glycosyltransferase involved in cell wall biosynthesis